MTQQSIPNGAEFATEPVSARAEAAAQKTMRLATLIGFILAAVLAFAFACTPLRTSTDEFWQLKAGQWIVQHGALPQNEIFTYTAAHLPWHNHEWLTQALMWKLYALGEATDFGGWRAVILAKSLLIVLAYAGFGLLLARRMRQPAWAALAAAMAADLGRRTFYPRPPVITYLFLAGLFWLLIEWRAGRLRERWLWLLVPLFALWSNLHGGWMAGILFAGAFWADALWGVLLAWRLPEGRAEALRRFGRITLLGGACILATMANPSGYHLYELPLTVGKDKYLSARIGEMMPPDYFHVWIAEGVILTLIATALRPVRFVGWINTLILLAIVHCLFQPFSAILHAVLTHQSEPIRHWVMTRIDPLRAWALTAVAVSFFIAAVRRVRPAGWLAHALIGAFFLQQGLHHVRHLPLTAVAILPTLAWSLEGWAEAWSRQGSPERRRMIAASACLGIVTFLTTYGLFSGREYFSVLERNAMLLSQGLEFQPTPVNATGSDWLVNSQLPKGTFMINAYPDKAVDFMLRAKLPGPIWNDGNNAGYLIWRLSPEKYKVFTDNRYDIYGGLVVREEHSVNDGWSADDLKKLQASEADFFKGPTPPPWDGVLDKHGVQTVFIQASARGNMRLEASKKWKLVWEDYDFNIWVRDTPQNREAIERALALPRPVTARRIH